ncbi:MAG: SH3 domain-containing protein [Chloroflexi bacterium]|nr:SH3 domain-containing protein [Chloroflexota bacterium]
MENVIIDHQGFGDPDLAMIVVNTRAATTEPIEVVTLTDVTLQNHEGFGAIYFVDQGKRAQNTQTMSLTRVTIRNMRNPTILNSDNEEVVVSAFGLYANGVGRDHLTVNIRDSRFINIQSLRFAPLYGRKKAVINVRDTVFSGNEAPATILAREGSAVTIGDGITFSGLCGRGVSVPYLTAHPDGDADEEPGIVNADFVSRTCPRPRSDKDSKPSGSSGSSGASSDSSENRGIAVFRYSPAQTCQTLQPDIVVNNAGPGTACQRVNQPAGLGHSELVAAMPYATVDIWGEVSPNTQVCFRAASGSIKFVDTYALPRTIADLPPFYHPGLLCASINAPGQVALVAGPTAPVPTAIPPVYQSLQYCMVRTQYILNLRAAPAGEIIDILPFNIKLTALERTDGWLKVDYHGVKGWISADFVETIGLCGQ